jgi:hypothetical protein
MYINIDHLTPSHVKLLSKWASVQRTVTQARHLLLECATRHQQSDMTLDDINACVDELSDIGPALDALHQLVRSQLWAREASATKEK